MTLLEHEKTLYLHRKKGKRWKKEFLHPPKKWSNYLQLKSYVNNTPVKTAIYSRFTAQHVYSHWDLVNNWILKHAVCLNCLSQIWPRKQKLHRSGGGYSLSFDAPTPRFAPPWSLASLRRAKVRSENKERCYCKITNLTIVEFSAIQTFFQQVTVHKDWKSPS